jgi:hypothetical protein
MSRSGSSLAWACSVATVGEFGSGPDVLSSNRVMVLPSTPVSRAISRLLVPAASSVATVFLLFGFKTFTLHAPLRCRRGKVTSCQQDCFTLAISLMASLGGQEAGDFGSARGEGFCPANGG